MRRGFWVLFVLIIVFSLMLSGCQSNSVPKGSLENLQENETTQVEVEEIPTSVGLGTGPTGGSLFNVSTGVAKVINDNSPIKVIVQPSGGSVAFLPLLDTGEFGLAVTAIMDLSWAYNGLFSYNKPYKNLRLLMRGHEQPSMTFAVRADSGIKSIKDLRGKRVAGEYGAAVVCHRMVSAGLESVGLTWDDVKIIPVADPQSAFRALQEGRVDACFGATPTGAQTLEIDAGTPLLGLNFGDLSIEEVDNPPQEVIDVLQKWLPAAGLGFQKKEGYLKEDGVAIVYDNWLAASAKLSNDAVYEIVKALYENDQELHSIYRLLSMWKQEDMFEPNPTDVPYHEGAVRFWMEKGLWTPEDEAHQKRLLGQ